MNLTEFKPGRRVDLSIMGEEWRGVIHRTNGKTLMYLVGELPEVWTPENRVRFRIEFEYWYVVAYMDKFDTLPDEVKKLHPFGNNWMLEQMDGREYPCVQGHLR